MFSVDSDCENIGEVNKDKRIIDVHVREVANFGPKLSLSLENFLEGHADPSTCCVVIVYTLQKACQCLAVGRDSHLVCNVFRHTLICKQPQ